MGAEKVRSLSICVCPTGSDDLHRTQDIISIDNFTKSIFIGAIAAVGVGMKALDEVLVPTLDVHFLGFIVKT